MKNPLTLFLSIVVFCVFFSCEKKQETTVDANHLIKSTIDELSTTNDLEGKTLDELRILRNEIFARKGYVFNDAFLNDHFLKQDWYTPNKDVHIELTASEKERIATIKQAEALLKPFELPEGYSEILGEEILGNSIKEDIDNDGIIDVIQVARNEDDNSKVIFITLSTHSKLQKIYVTRDEIEYVNHSPYLEYEDDVIRYGVDSPGTGHFSIELELSYNPTIKNLQLTHYTSSHRIMYGHTGTDYDVITGDYTVTEESASIDDDTMRTTVQKGRQQSTSITPALINEGLYDYLFHIGREFEDDYYDDMEEKRHCTELLATHLSLEFTYGKLDYLGGYNVYEKDLKDFMQSIDVEALLNSSESTYSKSYRLHRNWVLDYVEEDECEDSIELTIDNDTRIATITINNCALVKEDGETIHSSEQNYFFEYKIGPNCTYEFIRVTGAG